MMTFIILGLFLLVIYLFWDSGVFVKIADAKKRITKRVRISTPATLYVKSDEEKKYRQETIQYDRITIGQSKSSDIILDDESCEKHCHAVIRMKNQNGQQSFLLKNCSRRNPIEFLEIPKKKYFYMKTHETIELADGDGFVVGNTKIIFKMNQPNISWTVPVDIGLNGYSCETTNDNTQKKFSPVFKTVEDMQNKRVEMDSKSEKDVLKVRTRTFTLNRSNKSEDTRENKPDIILDDRESDNLYRVNL